MKRKITVMLCFVMMVAAFLIPEQPALAAASTPEIVYSVHVQRIGDQRPVSSKGNNVGTAGTEGQGLRLENIQMRVSGVKNLGVKYRTHVESFGWMPWVKNGKVSGTSGMSKRMEAIEIKLAGKAAKQYDVYYRVHVQSIGWMGWVKNGQTAGTVGRSLRMEAIQIRIMSKSKSKLIDSTGLACASHVQQIGWQGYVGGGEISGTVGKGLRVEAIRIKPQGKADLHVNYATHVQGIGWMSPVSDDQLSGTTGQGRRIEAFYVSLSGKDAIMFDVYYRAHVQSLGWLGWAKNGEKAGSSGFGLRMEAFQVKLVLKGSGAPGSTEGAFLSGENNKNKRVAIGNKLFVFNSSGSVARIVDGSKPMVALTYDDGPAQGTSTILDVLERNHAAATFYVVGNRVNSFASDVKRAYNMGCEIGNHTWDHTTLSNLTSAQIASQMSQTDAVVESVTGAKTTTMRPPGGSRGGAVQSSVGKPIIIWSVDTLDWKTRSASSTISSVLNNVQDGDVVLMHDLHLCTAEASKTIIPTLVNRGYQLVTVSELAYFRGGLQSGSVYFKFR